MTSQVVVAEIIVMVWIQSMNCSQIMSQQISPSPAHYPYRRHHILRPIHCSILRRGLLPKTSHFNESRRNMIAYQNLYNRKSFSIHFHAMNVTYKCIAHSRGKRQQNVSCICLGWKEKELFYYKIFFFFLSFLPPITINP